LGWKKTALIEDDKGKLIKAKYTEFRFKTKDDVESD
jgi:hypothetical protein